LRPFFEEEEADPRAARIYAALLDRCLVRFNPLLESDIPKPRGFGIVSRADVEASRGTYCWQALVELAAARPDKCLDVMLDRMPDNANLAMTLLVACATESTESVDFAFRSVRGQEEHGRGMDAKFTADLAERILRKGAEIACRVVASHAQQHRNENLREYCRQAWPGVDIATVFDQLSVRMPVLFDEDDFTFSYAWMLEQEVKERGPITLYGWDVKYRLPDYLERFPNGRHAVTARQAINP
jgi:hypothetical protein